MIRVVLMFSLCLALAGCLSDAARQEPPRPEVSLATPLELPSEWSALYRGHVPVIAGSDEAVRISASPAAAAEAVRRGQSSLALSTATAAQGLTTADFDSAAIGLATPFTFAVEDLSAAQVLALIGGTTTSWSEVGGPALRVRRELAADVDSGLALRLLSIQDLPRGLETPGSALIPPGTLRLVPSGAAGLGNKVLRVDGRLPGESGYPLTELRVVAGQGRAGDRPAMIAAELRRRVQQSRPVEVTLDAVGDLMFGRSIAQQMATAGSGFPFEKVRSAFSGDIRFANLELPLTERGVAAKKGYTFRAPPASTIKALQDAGINLLTLANNHLLDFGPEGLADTTAALDQAGIPYAGAGPSAAAAAAPRVLTVKGMRVALLGYANVPNDSGYGFGERELTATTARPGVAWGTVEAIRRDVAAAKAQADVVLVALHAGFEYLPTVNDVQIRLARAAIDAGAAAVLGAHPHVLQAIEYYKGAPILYSLGNFVFDLDDDDYRQPGLPSVLTMIATLTLSGGKVTGIRVTPAVIDAKEGRPALVSGPAARPVYERLYRLTDQANGGR